MKKRHQSTAKKVGAYGLLGTALLYCVGTPLAWGVLGYGTYRLGKSVYKKAKQNAKLRDDHYDLFI